jgi:hypothetical protein
MQYFSVELLAFAAALFAMSAYRCSYRVTTIQRNRVGLEPTITWTDMDRFFCVVAALEGILFSAMAIRFGATSGAITLMVSVSLSAGTLIGRLLAVSHLSNYRFAVLVANEKRKEQIRRAQQFFPSQSATDIEAVAAAGRAATIARNIAVDKATKWLRK